MSDILCLDTEPETVNMLKANGHSVTQAPFGYRDGIRYLHVAPHDFDLIVCDLRNPACYDEDKWGPYGGNDNYKCRVVPRKELTWETRLISRGPGSFAVERYRYHLISETQVERMNPTTPFGPKDVRQAIALGGIPAVIFLNPEWMLRTGNEFPDFVGLHWGVGKANASKITILEPLATIVRGWEPALDITVPVTCMLRSGPTVPLRVSQDDYLDDNPIVVDRVNSMLGQVARCGKGTVWMVPATNDNARAASQFASNLDALTRFDASVPAAPKPGGTTQRTKWDIFISHASEDKKFTDQLYAALSASGVKVWYDKSVLTMGDSLRAKIDEGLAGSRFGVVVLSHAFFNKDWPKAELDALVGLQMGDGRKRILPVWHEMDRKGVAKYSPLLANLLGSESRLGIQENIEDILAATDWPNGRVES